MAANLKLGTDSNDFVVVGDATDPKCVVAIQEALLSGAAKEITFSFTEGFSERRFYVALLRAAYLSVFRQRGYEFAQHDVVQVIRRRICDPTLTVPDLKTLICELKPQQIPFDQGHVIIEGKVADVDCFLVMIRLRLKKQVNRSYFGVYLPGPGDRCDEFFSVMESYARSTQAKSLTIPASAMLH